MLNIMGKSQRSKPSLGRSNFEDSSIPFNPKRFDINLEILLLLLNSGHLGWQFNILPDVSSNTIIGLLMNVLPNVSQVGQRHALQYIGKFCLLSLTATTNLLIMDIFLQSILITQHFMMLLIIRSHHNAWNAQQESPSFRPRINQLFIYKLLDLSKLPYHTTVMYVHPEIKSTIGIIVTPFGFTHQRRLMLPQEPRLSRITPRN